MTDIEIKRKELETAKRILKQGHCGAVQCPIGGYPDHFCPFYEGGCAVGGFEPNPKLDEVNAFIATREAELSALENGGKPLESKYTQEPGYSGCTIGVAPESISIDAIALALIQGGYYKIGENRILYDNAKWIKEESDRRNTLSLQQEKTSGEV